MKLIGFGAEIVILNGTEDDVEIASEAVRTSKILLLVEFVDQPEVLRKLCNIYL